MKGQKCINLVDLRSGKAQKIQIVPEEKLDIQVQPYLSEETKNFNFVYNAALITLDKTYKQIQQRTNQLFYQRKRSPAKIDYQSPKILKMKQQVLHSNKAAAKIEVLPDFPRSSDKLQINIKQRDLQRLLENAPIFKAIAKQNPAVQESLQDDEFVANLQKALCDQSYAKLLADYREQRISNDYSAAQYYAQLRAAIIQERQAMRGQVQGPYADEMLFLLQFVNIEQQALQQLLEQYEGDVIKVIQAIEEQMYEEQWEIDEE